MAKVKRPTVTDVFDGQGCLVIFDEVSDYETATVASITGKGALDLGQILNGSSEWTGDAASFDNLTDEQGDVIVPRPTAGTYGFDFFMADFSAGKLKDFMHAREITLSGMEDTAFSGATKAMAMGEQIGVIERPIAWVNSTFNKAFFFPKARIATSPGYDEGIMGLQATVVAQDCNTNNLGTFMTIDKFNLQYETE